MTDSPLTRRAALAVAIAATMALTACSSATNGGGSGSGGGEIVIAGTYPIDSLDPGGAAGRRHRHRRWSSSSSSAGWSDPRRTARSRATSPPRGSPTPPRPSGRSRCARREVQRRQGAEGRRRGGLLQAVHRPQGHQRRQLPRLHDDRAVGHHGGAEAHRSRTPRSRASWPSSTSSRPASARTTPRSSTSRSAPDRSSSTSSARTRSSLVPNPEYYGGAPKVTKVTIKKMPELAARLTALRTGEVDVVWGIPDDQLPEAAEATPR